MKTQIINNIIKAELYKFDNTKIELITADGNVHLIQLTSELYGWVKHINQLKCLFPIDIEIGFYNNRKYIEVL